VHQLWTALRPSHDGDEAIPIAESVGATRALTLAALRFCGCEA